ncbi:hypothetical protein ACSQ67_020889 [Phaseolus vulgaris]
MTKASKDHVEELVIEDYLIPPNPVHHAKLRRSEEMKRKGGESEEIEDRTWVREACVDYKGEFLSVPPLVQESFSICACNCNDRKDNLFWIIEQSRMEK